MRHRKPPRPRRRFSRAVTLTALVAICTGVLVATAVTSWAMFTDSARVDTTFAGAFTVGLRDSTNTVRQASDKTVRYTFTDTGDLVPGNTVVLTLAPFNDSRATKGQLGLTLSGAGSLAPYLRYSVAMDDRGTVTKLLGDPDDPSKGISSPAGGLSADLGAVDAAGKVLKNGDAWPSSADASLRTLTISVHLADDAALRGLSSGTAAVTIHITGKSVSQ
ncbi:hypothetical protein [Luethyella okanaganae]|uniref:Ribosomally synthesized peptide with SipW-like signal peptide n=1 Tax=Luethyella okanaganae TaxID=69372 RepID=A0ABW1VFL4_9MICO